VAKGAIELVGLRKEFGSVVAVAGIDVEIAGGEFFSLLGPSGCGKTTTLRMIAGFEQPTSGSIYIDGVDVARTPPHKRPVNTVFQSYALFPLMTVYENVAFGLAYVRATKGEIEQRVRAALAMVRLASYEKRRPAQLSGGQQQRVALARALVLNPAVLLLDEPLGALDAKLREEMQIELIDMQREVGITFVFVTHSQNEALALSSRIAVMNAGRVEQLDEPSRLYGFPRNRFVADFIGKINLFNGEIVAVDGERVRLRAAGLGEIEARSAAGLRPGTPATLALRPEQVRIAAIGAALDLPNRYPGKVRDFLYVGDVTTYVIDLQNGQRLQALLPNSSPGRAKFFEAGDAVTAAWPAEAGVVLTE
jgi:spermidine/putrescine transport system ATP-binding protein